MRHYIGSRDSGGRCHVSVWDDSGQAHLLDPRLDLWNHSPSGFEWGYGGAGPAQLALALIADATGDDGLAVLLYQRFKRRWVAKLNCPLWGCSQPYICGVCLDICSDMFEQMDTVVLESGEDASNADVST